MRQTCHVLIFTLTVASFGSQAQVGKQRPSVMCDHAAPPPGMHWRCDDRADQCNCHLESDNPDGPPLLEDKGLVKNRATSGAANGIHTEDFYNIMNALAVDRNSGKIAAGLFTDTVIYTNAARGQTSKGKAAFTRLFDGTSSEPKAEKVEWHHLMFNERDQIGAGEFTVEGRHRSHGVAIVRIEHGRIANWREYPVASTFSWQRLSGENPF